MAAYEYACAACGPFELARPIGTAPPRDSVSGLRRAKLPAALSHEEGRHVPEVLFSVDQS